MGHARGRPHGLMSAHRHRHPWKVEPGPGCAHTLSSLSQECSGPDQRRGHGKKEEMANGKVDSSERCQGGKHAIVTLLSNTQLLEKDLRP